MKLSILLALIPAAAAKGCTSTTQLHIAGGQDSATEMTISYVSAELCDSTVHYGLSDTELTEVATSKTPATTYSHHSKDHGAYTSGYIHHVTLTGLSPKTTYYYGIPTCDAYSTDPCVVDQPFEFTTAPKTGTGYPTTFAIVGDLGQTINSMQTVKHMAEDEDINAILHAGDMSYSDCEQPRWDSWFQMVEFLSVSTPWYVCGGNHEAEYNDETGETFTAYEARFRMPQVKPAEQEPQAVGSQDACCPSEGDYTYDFGNAFYSFEYGPSTVIFLNSYTHTTEESKQYAWLVDTLKKIDRSLTPWVVVLFHCPWYNSFSDHQGEKQQTDMKGAMEDLFIEYRVNIVFTGHVHGYERTHNVAKEVLDEKGPSYVIIGDGGNREGHAAGFLDPSPPAWSAFRDNTIFGHGTLELANSTHAYFNWHKNVGTDLFEVSDCVSFENQYFMK